MKQIDRRSMNAVRHHLENIKKLAKNPSEKELEEMYSYLDKCWICDKPITFWDRLTFNVKHSFEGNSHRRKCQLDEKK